MSGLELTKINEPLFLSHDLEGSVERASRESSLRTKAGQASYGKSAKV